MSLADSDTPQGHSNTESDEDFDVEEWWAEVVAFAQGIALHHCAEVLLSVMGNDTRYLIRVVEHPVGAAVAGGATGGVVGFEIGGAIGAGLGGGVGPLITYLLTHR